MSTQSKRVLLIEDNPGDVDLVRLMLVSNHSDRDVSFEVSSVDRLATGLAALTKERPAAILLDLYLPDSRGSATFHDVLNRAAGIAVVVLTGRDDEEMVMNALKHGVQDYLVKGVFDSNRLGRTLRCAIERQALVTALGVKRQQQLEFKEQFLSAASHELRTGLTSIDHLVTAILDDFATPVTLDQRQHLNAVLRSVDQLRSMIDDQLQAKWDECAL
jgi:response regulator of citrate/malate metabolism